MSEMVTTGAGGPDTGELPLSFEAWAEMSARLVRLSPEERATILHDRGLDPEVWQQCDDHYARQIGNDVENDRFDRRQEYGQKCAAELERRRREASATRRADTSASDPTTGETAWASPGLSEPNETPTYLRDPRPFTAGLPPSPTALAATTAALDLPNFVKLNPPRALPFDEASTSEAVPPTRVPAPAVPSSGGETMAVSVDLVALAGAPLPFAKPAEGPHPRLPLVTYASLCAELSCAPDEAGVLMKYNITSATARGAVEREWQARFVAHPDVHQEWQQLVSTYREWLLRQGK